MFLCSALLALSGCGDDDEGDEPASAPANAETTEQAERVERKGTTIVASGSEFGEMLFDSRRQAIYIFENDRRGESRCYDDCAEAWPPVVTDGAPKAGAGVDESLLGTTTRRDGERQVTYAGKPLYYYAHEAPGEVRCHNVNLNGGYWWVVGPDGERRP